MAWLLIFDNVCDPSELELFIPYGACGTIIMTTRDIEVARALSSPEERMEMLPFAREESIEFLLRLVRNHQGEQPSTKDITAANTISDGLGDLPLALNMIGSYIAYYHSNLANFQQEHTGIMHQYVFECDTKHPEHYQSPIDLTWTAGLSSLSYESQLLAAMVAFLDPDGVPAHLFEERPREDMYVASFIFCRSLNRS